MQLQIKIFGTFACGKMIKNILSAGFIKSYVKRRFSNQFSQLCLRTIFKAQGLLGSTALSSPRVQYRTYVKGDEAGVNVF